MTNLHKLIFLFIFFFSQNVYSESIADIEIEGITLGSSMLDYLYEPEIKGIIKNKKNDSVVSPKYSTKVFIEKPNGDSFDVGLFTWVIALFEKKKNYKIVGLFPIILEREISTKECKVIQNEMYSDILNAFPKSKPSKKYLKIIDSSVNAKEITIEGGYAIITREVAKKNVCEISMFLASNQLAKSMWGR
jgi:hypothetical protein